MLCIAMVNATKAGKNELSRELSRRSGLILNLFWIRPSKKKLKRNLNADGGPTDGGPVSMGTNQFVKYDGAESDQERVGKNKFDRRIQFGQLMDKDAEEQFLVRVALNELKLSETDR